MMKKPIKVMHVLRPVHGGMRQHLIGLVNYIGTDQVETIVVCSKDSNGFSPSELPNSKIIPLEIKGDFDLKNDYRIAGEIFQIALREEVDIIHAHGVRAGFICLWAAINRQRRFVFICTFHNQFCKSHSLLKNCFNKFIVKIIAGRANRVITVSQAIRKELVNYLNVYPFKISCIYNGIPLDKFQNLKSATEIRAKIGVPRFSVLIGTVARLIPQKGVSVLIKAAVSLHKKFPDVYFTVIGDGPFRDSLELEAAGAGLKKYMIFTGFRNDVPDILSSLDIFVLPTLEEGFSIVTLEAMALKKPVIVSEVGGLPEIITSETGITVSPNKPERLETALADLICNPAKRILMGNSALERIKQMFTVEQMAAQHLTLYQETIAAKNGD
jgi:glycosyltransferase involved in cell wall biosynthesis